MKIVAPGLTGASSVRPARDARRSGGANFARELPSSSDGAAAPRPMGGAPFVNAVEVLLALHEEDEGQRNRRQAIDRGEVLLERLDGLRNAMLCGRLDPAEVNALATAVAARRRQPCDPALDAILSEIELRAAVEIEKLRLAADELI